MSSPTEPAADRRSRKEEENDDSSECTHGFVCGPVYLCYNLICFKNVK